MVKKSPCQAAIYNNRQFAGIADLCENRYIICLLLLRDAVSKSGLSAHSRAQPGIDKQSLIHVDYPDYLMKRQ